jgi:hypothetical protein
VKVEVPKVKVEVKDEPPSPPHGQPPTSRAPKRARTEATQLEPPPLEAWRATFAIPPMYRCPKDGEWAGYNAAIHLSAEVVGIIVIDDDEDDAGGVSADVKGKAPL